MIKHLYFIFLMLLACCYAQAQTVDEMLEQHKAWTRNNAPNPHALSDEQLAILTANTIESMCNDKEIMEVFYEAERRFSIPGFSEYADIRKRNVTDMNDNNGRQLMRALLSYSKHRFGNVSYPVAYIYSILSRVEQYEHVRETVEEQYAIAKQLFDSDSTIANEELLHNARINYLMACKSADNPLLYEECLDAISDAIAFYEANDTITDLRSKTYMDMGQWLSDTRTFATYYNEIWNNHKEIQRKYAYDKFMGAREYAGCKDSVYISSQLLILASVKMTQQLLHSYHPDYLASELSAYCCNVLSWFYVDSFAFGVRLQNICKFLRQYAGDDTPVVQLSHRAMDAMGMNYDEFRIDEKERRKDADIVRKYDNGEGRALMAFLFDKIESNTIYGDSVNLDDIREYMDLVDVKFKDNPAGYFMWKGMLSAQLQCKGIKGYTTAFNRILSEYRSKIETHKTWEMVAAGKSLIKINIELMSNFSEAISLNKRLIKLEKELSADNYRLFACEYYDYGFLTKLAYPNFPPTLEGRYDALALLDDVASECHEMKVLSSNINIIAANYCMGILDTIAAKRYLYKVKETINDDYHLIMHLGIGELVYSYLLQCYVNEGKTDSISICVNELEESMKDGYAYKRGSYEAYMILAGYYGTHGNIKRSEEILRTCLNAYDEFGYTKYDGNYMQILTSLFQLYGNISNDIDKCHQLLENVEEDMNYYKDIINPEAYLVFLKMYYDMLEGTDPANAPLLSEYSQRFSNVLEKLQKTDPDSERIFYTYALYMYAKKINIASRNTFYRNIYLQNGNVAEFDRMWSDYCADIRETIIPELEKRRYEVRKYGNMLTANIIFNLAVAYDKCTSDTAKAEEYYRELYRLNPMAAAPWIMEFYLNCNKPEMAAEVAEDTENRYNDGLSLAGDDDSFLSQRKDLILRVFWAYYRNGQYDKAFSPAKEYCSVVQKYIKKNFTLLTLSERETFLGYSGAAGFPLQCLLPHIESMTENPAGEIYNSLLHDKGLLLRSTHATTRAIYASGNKELISNMDSIRVLRDEISNMGAVAEPINANSLVVRKYETLKILERSVYRATEAFNENLKLPTWEDIRAQLKADEAAVEFIVTDSVIGALVLRHDSRIPDYVSLMNFMQTMELFELMKNHSQEEIADLLYVKDSLHLYEKIWKPIERFFSGKERTVYYSPSGILNTLSFAAIKCDDGQNLMDHYQLRQLTTTGRLAERKQNAAKSRNRKADMTLFGAICYDGEQVQDYETAETDLTSRDDKKKREAENDFPFLPYTIDEVRSIEQVFHDNGSGIEVKEKLDATESEFRKLDGHSTDMIHLSTHGYYYFNVEQARSIQYFRNMGNLNAMTLSGLALSNAKAAWYGDVTSSTDDNILTSAEVASLDLSNTRFAFLSACQTGLGSVTTDGVLGLQRGFKQAGVNTLCVSLWSVNDNSTANMISNFYKYLINSRMTSHDAMQKAMQQQRSLTPSPYDWASFVVIDAPF